MPTFFRGVFFIGDFILLNVSILLSYRVFNQSILGEELSNSVYLFIFSNLGWFFLVIVSNPYRFSRASGILRVFKSQISFIFIHLLIVASLIFFFKKTYEPIRISVMYSVFIALFFLWKILMLYIFSLFKKEATETKNVIIVGRTDLGSEVSKYLVEHPELNYKFLNYFERDIEISLVDQLRSFCRENTVHEIYCCMPDLTQIELKEIVELGLNRLIKVKIVSDLRSFHQKSIELDQFEYLSLSNITTIPLDESTNRYLKRVFDFIFASMVCAIILSWLVPILGMVIKLDSPGPVFFKQRRAGRDNKPFRCLKFRSMVMNREADSKQATKDDERITKLGKFLRRTSLDEVPQFLNVLIGDMSVIGPRPHPFNLNEMFSPKIERLMSRHYVKPGITGLAQAMGYRGETKTISDMRNRIKLDRFYIENWSLYLDMKILIQTVVSLLRGSENAY